MALLDITNIGQPNYNLITTPQAAPVTTPTAAPAPTQSTSAGAQFAFLEQMGLGDLGKDLWNQFLNGVPIETVLINMRQDPRYKKRFPAMEALSKDGRAITEAEYINLESAYIGIMRSAGLPTGFFDSPNDFAKFIENDVSPAELEKRVFDGIIAAEQAPQEVKDQLSRLYGINQGSLAAYYLDPDRALPVLERQFTAAQISGAGTRTGFGQLSLEEAERLAALGVTDARAAQGFGEIMQGQQLYNPLPGQTEDTITRQEQLAGALEGNVAAQQKMENAARRRRAAFQTGGEFAAGQRGVSGLGSAQT